MTSKVQIKQPASNPKTLDDLYSRDNLSSKPGESDYRNTCSDYPPGVIPCSWPRDEETRESERFHGIAHVFRNVITQRRGGIFLQIAIFHYESRSDNRWNERGEYPENQLMYPDQVRRREVCPNIGRELRRMDILIQLLLSGRKVVPVAQCLYAPASFLSVEPPVKESIAILSIYRV